MENRGKLVAAIINWYKANGRKSLPWRMTSDPYQILIAELMLQKTHAVQQVLPVFQVFVKKFPDIKSLSEAKIDEIKGIIKSFTTVVDNKKLGKNVTAFIFLNTRSDKTQEIADQLLAIEGIADVYISLGVYDIIAKVHCADVVALKELTEKRLNDINGIIEVRPSIVFTEVMKQ